MQLLRLMCLDAASTIERQCGREYGFGKDYSVITRATDTTSQSSIRKIIPSGNAIAEREFAKFDHTARVTI